MKITLPAQVAIILLDLRDKRERLKIDAELNQNQIDIWERIAVGDIEELRSIAIEYLELPLRPYRALKNKGYTTIGKVIDLDRIQLIRIEDMGPKSVEDVVNALSGFGVNLRPTPPAIKSPDA